MYRHILIATPVHPDPPDSSLLCVSVDRRFRPRVVVPVSSSNSLLPVPSPVRRAKVTWDFNVAITSARESLLGEEKSTFFALSLVHVRRAPSWEIPRSRESFKKGRPRGNDKIDDFTKVGLISSENRAYAKTLQLLRVTTIALPIVTITDCVEFTTHIRH